MEKKQAGESVLYEYNDKMYLATIQNTFTNDEGVEVATLSLSGTDIVIVVENNF